MIKITFVEPTDKAWVTWKTRCTEDAARLDGMSRDERRKLVKKRLYALQGHVFLAYEGQFHGKCAYCECSTAVSQPGDLDHFRPKGGVTDINGNPVMITAADGRLVEHYGYYWLSFDWRNLLPSCRDCNSPSSKKTGTLIGKGTRFPVRGKHASMPAEQDGEEPLLINPADPNDDDPANHLEVDKTGVMLTKSDRGDACVMVFGLNARPALVQARRDAYHKGSESILRVLEAARNKREEDLRLYREQQRRFFGGAEQFSAAGRAGIAEARIDLKPYAPDIFETLGSS